MPDKLWKLLFCITFFVLWTLMVFGTGLAVCLWFKKPELRIDHYNELPGREQDSLDMFLQSEPMKDKILRPNRTRTK